MMHELLIDKYGIETEVEASEVTSGYTGLFEEGVNSGNRCIALASMLPCMWIYNRVGLEILKIAKLEDNPYKEWILEYGNEEFTKGVNTVLDIIDRWAERADDKTKADMKQYYLKAALYEYAFWDYGYEGDSKSYKYSHSLEGWV
jgi:thiaminase/transcriptional activator TenA